MFLKRSSSAEIMDDFSINDARIDDALKELKNVNRFLGGISATRKGLSYFKSNKQLTVLDTGAGASDIMLALNKKNHYHIFALDKNKRASTYLKNHSAIKNIICGDILHLPVKKKFDIIHCSLFLHHFKHDELVKIISELMMICNKGIIINDLRRSVFAMWGIKILTSLFSKSEMVKNDAPLSVKRGFTKNELIKVLKHSGCTDFIIKRKWAFRWLVVIKSVTALSGGHSKDNIRTIYGQSADFRPRGFLLPSGLTLHQDYDVTVIGGGPAGAAVSYLLSQSGLSVCLVEKKEFPRNVLCGEFLSHEVIGFLKREKMFDDFLSLNPNRITKLSIKGCKAAVDTPLGFSGFGLRRSLFDNLLLQKSCEKGTRVIQPAEVVHIARVNGIHELTVKLSNRFHMFTSSVVIGAYGRQNVLDKKLNRSFTGYHSGLNGVKYQVPLNLLNNFDEDSIAIFASDGIYCGVNKTDNNIATVCWLEKHNGINSKDKIKELAEENKFFNELLPSPDKVLNNFTVYGTGNIYFGKKNKVENGVFMCGDSAGIISPLAGDGIGMAIESAGILSNVLLKYFHHTINKEEAADEYNNQWNKTFRSRIRTASYIQSILLSRDLRDKGLSLVSKHPGILPHLIKLTRGK